MTDVFGENDRAAFRIREQERAEIRSMIEPILAAIADAEAKLSNFSVFQIEERHGLASARLELLGALRSIEKAAKVQSEGFLRVAEKFVESHAS